MLTCILESLCGLGVLSYLIPFLVAAFVWKEQNLKEKYKAQWALVTGASSGIGRALAEKLASQGLNVVLVALDDKLLQEVFTLLQKKYPQQQFRAVGVDLGQPTYLETIVKATADISVQLIFNNAGFVATGLFADSPLAKQMSNYECNAIAPVKITHHFLNILLDKKLKGCIGFTSSPAGFIPCPMTVMYGATKAFLSEFAVSVGAEVKADGVDVLVVHPSPVDTAFYAGNTHEIGAMKMFQRTATAPTTIASCFFISMGKSLVHDQGYFSLCSRLLLKVLDSVLLANIIGYATSSQADYKKSKKKRE
jgi:short-subunit dehydrogenase